MLSCLDFHLQWINTEAAQMYWISPMSPTNYFVLLLPPPSSVSCLPLAYSSCWWLTWCSSSVRLNLLRGIVATRKGRLPSGLISCLLISWKTSMKNSLFLFPQCNILMESDGNAEPYLLGSYEEFVTALISLYNRPWWCAFMFVCVLIAALDPKAFIFFPRYACHSSFPAPLSAWTD